MQDAGSVAQQCNTQRAISPEDRLMRFVLSQWCRCVPAKLHGLHVQLAGPKSRANLRKLCQKAVCIPWTIKIWLSFYETTDLVGNAQNLPERFGAGQISMGFTLQSTLLSNGLISPNIPQSYE